MSAPKECNACAQNGVPGALITFKEEGTKPDGSKHEHKRSGGTVYNPGAKAVTVNEDVIAQLAKSMEHLAAAIEGLTRTLGK